MSAKQILISVSIFFLGFIGVIAGNSFLSFPTEMTAFGLPTPTPTPVTLLIPKNALQGKLIQASGTVTRIPWDKTEFEPATAGAVLFQTDEIATKEKSNAVFAITASISGTLYEQTHIVLGSLLPGRIAIHQKTGSAEYKTTDTNETLSIKILGALILLEQGTVAVTKEDAKITIALLAGNAKLGYIDNDNTTRVWELTKDDIATINDTTGNVKTTGRLLTNNK